MILVNRLFEASSSQRDLERLAPYATTEVVAELLKRTGVPRSAASSSDKSPRYRSKPRPALMPSPMPRPGWSFKCACG